MQRSSRSIKGDAGLTRKLVEEAAAMEARLAELKLTMIQERSKREAMAAASTTGSIWNNGSACSLRSKGMQRQRQSSSATVTAPPRLAAPGSVLNPTPPSAMRPTAGAADSTARTFSRNNSRTCISSSSSKPDTLICSEHSQAGSIGGREAAASSLFDGAYNEAESRAMFQAAISEWRAAGVRSSSHGDTTITSRHSAEVSCEGTGAGSLLHGTYDEAANRDSFQKALQEWRAAGSGSSNGGSKQAGSSPLQEAVLGCGAQGKQVDTAAITCQTEAQQMAAPAAGSLPRGAGSRGTSAAGSACASGCSGSYLLKMLASSRSSSMNDRSAGAVFASTISGHSRSSSADEDSVGQSQACQQDQQVLHENSTGDSAACMPVQKNSSGSSSSAAVEPVFEPKALETECSTPDTAQPPCALNDWMATLQETEHAASMLAAAPADNVDSAAGTSAGREDAVVPSSTAVIAGPAAKMAGATEYQQHLQQVLSELEQLEQLQAAGCPCTSQTAPTAEAHFQGVCTGTAALVGMRLPETVELPNN